MGLYYYHYFYYYHYGIITIITNGEYGGGKGSDKSQICYVTFLRWPLRKMLLMAVIRQQVLKPLVWRDDGYLGASLVLAGIESPGCGMGMGCWAGPTAPPCSYVAIWVHKGIIQHRTVISQPFSPPCFGHLLICIPFFHPAALRRRQPAAVSLPCPPPAASMIKMAPG